MTEKTANLFRLAIELQVIQNIKPYKASPHASYMNFDVLGTICFSFEEALQCAINQLKEL